MLFRSIPGICVMLTLLGKFVTEMPGSCVIETFAGKLLTETVPLTVCVAGKLVTEIPGNCVTPATLPDTTTELLKRYVILFSSPIYILG